jgi:hypothetical protein
MRNFFGHEQRQKVLIGPRLLLGAPREFAPRAASIRQVQASEQRVEVVI